MSEQEKIQLFENQRIRTAWDAEKEEWYFSIVDVVGVLTETDDYETSRKYWNKLKQQKPVGLDESKKVTQAGGAAAKAAKDSIEATTGVLVITSKRAAELNHLVTDMIETSARIAEEEGED